MFIPAIDLKGGQVVQLVQGKRLALASDDIDAWVRKFAHYPQVQLIDLDGALETGANDAIVRRICAQLPCRVGGGVRTIDRAEALVAAGARQVIVSSALFAKGRIGQQAGERSPGVLTVLIWQTNPHPLASPRCHTAMTVPA